MKIAPFILAAIAALIGRSALADEQIRDQIILVAPALSGQSSLGRAVSQILQLKITKAFRLIDPDRPGIQVGRGAIQSVAFPLREANHKEAERLAHVNGAQMVLWGSAVDFQKGAAAQTYLTIAQPYRDYREYNNEIWTLQSGKFALVLDVPRRQISFPPIVISQELVSQFSERGFPKLCKLRDLRGCSTLDPEAIFRVQSWEGAGLAKVEYQASIWWLSIPTLGAYQFQTTSYVIGVIGLFRGDWNLVLRAMNDVLEGPQGTSLKIDAHIYKGIALFRLGRSGLDDLEAAYKLGTSSVRTVQFLAMGLLQEALKSETPNAESKQRAERAISILNDNQKLFLPQDPWFSTAVAISRSIIDNL